MSAPHIILDYLPSLRQKLSDLVEVWRSYNKNNFACFSQTQCTVYSLSDATADVADWQMSSVTSSRPAHRELRHVIVQLMTSRAPVVSLQRSTTLSSDMYVNQAPAGTTGFRQPNAVYTWHIAVILIIRLYSPKGSNQKKTMINNIKNLK